MNMLLFSVYDRVAQTYTLPQGFNNKAVASRWFEGLMKDTKLRPTDFDLVCVGSFGSDNGVLTALEKPEYLCNGGDFVNE